MPETLSALAVLTELRGSVDDAVELRETARTVTRMSETSRSALVRAARNGRLLPSEAEPPKGFFKFRLRNPDGYDRYLKLSGQTAHWIQQVCQRGSDAVLGDLQARVPSDIATLLSAVAQGILAGIGFYFAGLSHSVALLMLLMELLARAGWTPAGG